MSTPAAPNTLVCAEDLAISNEELQSVEGLKKAAGIYKTHGALHVRGLMKPYLAAIQRDIEAAAALAISNLDRAQKIGPGWSTPDGTLFISAPEEYQEILGRDKQIMILPVNYQTCGAFTQSALDQTTLNLVENIIGPNIELFLDGQCLYKEAVGGHPKNLHQDSAYFEHRFEGPVGVLNYAVDTDLKNGALHVVPGSHHFGTLAHIDTLSHLGLDAEEWPWERAVPICGAAGDAIFFHYKTIHGSKENNSDKARPVFIHRYRRPNDYVTIDASNAADRAELEKRDAEASKQNQNGWMVRGARG